MCLQFHMAPKRKTLQLVKDFWTPVDRTAVERPVVGSDDTTQDPNETQRGVDSQHVLHEPLVAGSNDTTQDPNETQRSVDPQHVPHEPPVVGSDDTTQDPNETQDGVDSQQCVGPDMEFGSSAQSGPGTSHKSCTSRVPRMLRGGKVHTIGTNYFMFDDSQLL